MEKGGQGRDYSERYVNYAEKGKRVHAKVYIMKERKWTKREENDLWMKEEEQYGV